MKKTLQVVMLPTNEKAKIGDIVLGLVNEEYSKRLFYGKKIQDPFNCTETNFHLYFLSDEEIKKGDWCYDEYNKVVFQNKSAGTPGASKKITATTDKSLMYLESDYSFNFPKPSEEFTEYFVEEYNKGNVITEVEVECENIDMDFDHNEPNGIKWVNVLKVNPDNTINIKPKKDSWSREEITPLIDFLKEIADDNLDRVSPGIQMRAMTYLASFEKNL